MFRFSLPSVRSLGFSLSMCLQEQERERERLRSRDREGERGCLMFVSREGREEEGDDTKIS